MPKKRIHFVSLGCPKNRVDTEVMVGVAGQQRWELTQEADDAEVIVVNTCGFIGEAFVVLACWNYSRVLAVITAMAVILTAAYVLWTVQRVYLGTNDKYKDYPDMNVREVVIAVPLLIFSVALGIFPHQLLLSWMQPSVNGLVESLSRLGGGH